MTTSGSRNGLLKQASVTGCMKSLNLHTARSNLWNLAVFMIFWPTTFPYESIIFTFFMTPFDAAMFLIHIFIQCLLNRKNEYAGKIKRTVAVTHSMSGIHYHSEETRCPDSVDEERSEISGYCGTRNIGDRTAEGIFQ